MNDFEYNFDDLTTLHGWLILYQGWRVGQRYPDGAEWHRPEPHEVRILLDRGLMTVRKVKYFEDDVIEYDVAIDVHMAFCMEVD